MGVAGTSQSVENERVTVVDRLEPPRTVSSRTYADLFSRPEAISCRPLARGDRRVDDR